MGTMSPMDAIRTEALTKSYGRARGVVDLTLVLWCALPVLATIVVFERRDLAR
jgi:hypothetical protein